MKTKYITPFIDTSQINHIDYWIEFLLIDYKFKKNEKLDISNILNQIPIHLLTENNIFELLEKNAISLFSLSLYHSSLITEDLIDKCLKLNLINSLHDIPSKFRNNFKYISYVFEKNPDQIKYISLYDYHSYYYKIMDENFLTSLISKNLFTYFNLFDSYFLKKNPFIALLKKSDNFASFFITALYKDMILEKECHEKERLESNNKYLSFKSKYPALKFLSYFSKPVLKKYFSKNNDILLFFIKYDFNLCQFLPITYRSDPQFVLNNKDLFLYNIKYLHHNILNDFNIMHSLVKSGVIDYDYIKPEFLNNHEFALNSLISNCSLSNNYDYSQYNLIDLISEAIKLSKKHHIYSSLSYSKYKNLMFNSKIVTSLLDLDVYEKFDHNAFLKKSYFSYKSYYTTEKVFQLLPNEIQSMVKNDFFGYYNYYGNDSELQQFMISNFFKYDLEFSLNKNTKLQPKSLKI